MLHVLMPFSRPQNKDFYLKNFKDKNIIWHPIFYVDPIEFTEDWIKPYNIGKVYKNIQDPYFKLNRFIENVEIIDDDIYCFLCDDDWYEDDVLLEIPNYDEDVIFISMKRGYKDIVGGHPCSTLITSPGVRAGSIGLEQMFVKGYVLKKIVFLQKLIDGMADGVLAEELQKKYKVFHLPELFALFNYLEEGRWNKKEEKQMETILDRFERVKREPRDINEHLNTLYTYATESGCDTIVELGTNEGISTTAFCLAVKNFPVKKLYCYDYIDIRPYYQELLNICENEKVEINFTHADSREIEIPECDLLFIDTLHVYEQLKEELKLHSGRTKKYIIMHDTEAFGITGVVQGSEGLKKAVDEFLEENKDDWKFLEHYQNNNGLTVLERIK